jgi:hypothetical protein
MQLAVDVGDIFFQWKHLVGVKERAEHGARTAPPLAALHVVGGVGEVVSRPGVEPRTG